MNNNFYIVGVEDLSDPEFIINDISVDRKADAIMSPVETGSYVFDNKVIRPTTVQVVASVHERYWDSVWTKLVKMFENRTYDFYEVCTKGEIIGNLMLLGLPRHEKPDKYDMIDVTLNFAQVVFAKEDHYKITKPMRKSDTSTQATGQKTCVQKTKGRSGYGIMFI